MNSIYDYFEDIYCVEGYEAEVRAREEAWELFNKDEEAFKAFAEEKGINLEVHTCDYAFSDFDLWCEEMAE